MTVPFLDLRLQHEPIRTEIEAAIRRVVDACAFAGGPFVESFERQFAAFCGSPHCVGVGNGTDALWLALTGLGVGPGDEVITTPMTFFATAEAISLCGARPVFADIDPATYTLDPRGIEAVLTPRTRAIVPVHLFGQMADLDPILDLAAGRGLVVVEDACQAHGATYRGRGAGTLGMAGCFSFYPGKNLGALGEAGAVITSDDGLAGRMRTFREHGQARKYHHVMVGWNARMDGIQGAVLELKLRRLASGNEARRAAAALYREALAGVPGVVLPAEDPRGVPVYHLFVVRVQARDRVLERLAARGIGCGIHYPVPVHLSPAYRHLGYRRGDFPVAERCADEFLSLPMFPELTREQVAFTAGELARVLEEAGKEGC